MKKVIRIICVCAALLLLIAGAKGGDDAFLGAFVIALPLLAVFWFLREKKPKRKAAAQSLAPLPRVAVPPEDRKTVTIPERVNGKQAHYRYSKVVLTDVAPDPESVRLGEQLILRQIGDRVSVMQDDREIGKLPDNRLAGMVRDWQRNMDPILAMAFHADNAKRELFVYLVFYEDVLAKMIARREKPILVRGSGNEDAQDAIGLLGVGDVVAISYNEEKQRYDVSSGLHDIGYFKAEDDDLGELAVIAEITENEETGRFTIRIFPY